MSGKIGITEKGKRTVIGLILGDKPEQHGLTKDDADVLMIVAKMLAGVKKEL